MELQDYSESYFIIMNQHCHYTYLPQIYGFREAQDTNHWIPRPTDQSKEFLRSK